MPETLDAEAQALYDEIAAGRRGRVAGPLALWLYAPALGRRLAPVGEYLRWGSSLAPEIVEACILVVAAYYRCAFIWAVHQPLAAAAGVDRTWVDSLPAGKTVEPANMRTRVAVALVRSLLNRYELEDDLFAAGLEVFGERGICELTALVGYYTSGALLLTAVRGEADEANPFRSGLRVPDGAIPREQSVPMREVSALYARAKKSARIDDVFDANAMRQLLNRFPNDCPPEAVEVSISGVQCMTITRQWHGSRTLVYVHGGGFVAGGWRSHGAWAASLASELRANLVFPVYCQAPEHRYPAAGLDVLAVLREISGKSRVGDWLVAGDSAGAALALNAAVLLRDEGAQLPLGLVLLCGMLEFRADISPYLRRSKRAREMVNSYFGEAQRRDRPANPMQADLRGLPPTLLQVGGADALRDDGFEFAKRLFEAKVAVTLECWPEQVHVWHRLGVSLPDVHAARARIAHFVETTVSQSSSVSKDG